MSDKAAADFQNLLDIMRRLRRECPWDKKQTPLSLRQYILEEAFEVVETIDEEDWTGLSVELGDLLLQIVFQSVIAEEYGYFTIERIIATLKNKLIERHPHVFSEKKVRSAKDVKENWENIKIRTENRNSLLSGVPRTAPALLRAQRIQEKASMVDFDWYEASDILSKLQEEIRELKEAIKVGQKEKIIEEIGDILFTTVNIARFLDVVAEDALRKSITKFIKRFQFVENYYHNDYEKMKQASLQELDQIWERSKEQNIDNL
jgi:MazG family protein